LAGFGEDAGLLAGALEATEGKLERLVFADFDAGHTESRFGLAARSTGEPRIIAMEVWLPQAASECPRGGPTCTGPWGSLGSRLSASRPHVATMKVLGIETSCDETGVAVYDTGAGLLAHARYSQVAMHAEYGGVVPGPAGGGRWRARCPGRGRCTPGAARWCRSWRAGAAGARWCRCCTTCWQKQGGRRRPWAARRTRPDGGWWGRWGWGPAPRGRWPGSWT